MLFRSGDELVPVGRALAYGQVFDANRPILGALLRALPATVTDLGVLPDEEQAVRRAMLDASAAHEVVLTSGGTEANNLVLLGAADTCVPAMAFALRQQHVERAAYSVRLEVVPDAGYHFDDPRYAAPAWAYNALGGLAAAVDPGLFVAGKTGNAKALRFLQTSPAISTLLSVGATPSALTAARRA